ncbi:MAG TPA: N-acetylneuraminate synthase family protein [Burkholderiales bacterium]|nr:N-acetylneuraminate synthase family protein [Burkholderiales bacterium]
MRFSIGKREVGDGTPCYVVYEAGPTHDGLDTAIDLSRLAAEAGADAVKFQILDPDRLVADRKQLFSYDVLVDRASGRTETISEPLYELLRRRSMPHADWRKLKQYCDGLGLAFFATVGFPDEVDFLAEIGCHSVKIASADINHYPLMRYAAQRLPSIQIDTGNATIGEVEAAVDVLRRAGSERVVIHHCPSGYPARLESINLRIIQTLKTMFDLPIAYSDHTPGWDMDIAAIALGANMVEKTITHDCTTRSVEHMFSLEPADMVAFVRAVRDLEIALGDARKQLSDVELKSRLAIRRSAHARRALRRGEALALDAIEFRRPGHGIAPDEIERYVGAAVTRDLAAGEMIRHRDLAHGAG